jgi:hypothetical protein
MPKSSAGSPRFPLNRIVALVGPLVAAASGLGVAWLGARLPGHGLELGDTPRMVESVVEFAIGAGAALALQHKWLDGWQKWEALALAPETLHPSPRASVREPREAAVIDVATDPLRGAPDLTADLPAPLESPGADSAIPPVTVVEDQARHPEDPVFEDPFAPTG